VVGSDVALGKKSGGGGNVLVFTLYCCMCPPVRWLDIGAMSML
jgi:hypothetical protein